MAYRALYRQYRPQSFSEVVGQEHITTILKNQAAAGHLAHAYLFCGSRGTGKTTTARILARAANCDHLQFGDPCNVCTACRAALDEGNADIIEIDAASNTGVDDVRAIIEQAQYAPLQLRMRVFIIDETHMLSAAAFNALLKTLEEPPAHVLFILATTEPQKVPATIVSRCQRFDFHRLSVPDIVATLKSVLTRAGAEVDEAGLLLIARAADGGMRDALSLTDQCLSFCGEHVTERDVYDVLGGMESGFLFELSDALLAGGAGRAVSMLDGIVRGGRDLTVFLSDLTAHFRALVLAKTCGECRELLDCTADTMKRYLEQAARASDGWLLASLERMLRAQSDMRYLAAPRIALESLLLRICRPEDARGTEALEERLTRLERALASGGAFAAPQVKVLESAPPSVQKDAPHRELAATPASPPPQQSAHAAIPPEPPAREAPGPAKTEATVSGPVLDANAATLWGMLLSELYKQNILVHALAKDGAALSLSGDGLLSVGFDDAHAAQRAGLSAPVNFGKLSGILAGIRPDARIALVRMEVKPASDADIERAKALFGDKLRIE